MNSVVITTTAAISIDTITGSRKTSATIGSGPARRIGSDRSRR